MSNLTAVAAYVYAGGFTLGLERAGYDVVAQLEGDGGYGADSAKLNWPERDIRFGPSNWNLDSLKGWTIDLAVANPPCAIFSCMGIATTRGTDAWRTDPRLQHWWDSFSLLSELRPRAWALESVTNGYTKGREVVDEMTKKALTGGYSVTHLLLDARWTGIPQSRKRFFILAHRPATLIGLDEGYWMAPPTVGEAMKGLNDPGAYRPVLSKYVAALAETRPGERLCVAWQRLNPGYATNLNAQGKVAGRPSFQDRRLNPDEVMGAYVGDKLYHPTEDRMLGIEEAKRLCGYPGDFQLAGPSSGWPSLLARAVMPPVGEWLGNAIRTTLAQPDADWASRRVTLVDVREPGRPTVDLTQQYLDEGGRVRLRARTDGSLDWSTSAVVKVLTEPATPRPANLGAGDGSRQEPPTDRNQGPGTTEIPPRSVVPLAREPLPNGAVSWTSPMGDAFVLRCEPSELPKASPGEPSGRFIERLFLETDLSPGEMVAAVHANYPGRKTRIGDVRFNHAALVRRGVAVRAFGTSRPVSVRVPKATVMNDRSPSEPVVTTATVEHRLIRNGSRPKILLTGSTALQCGSTKTSFKNLSNLAAIAAACGALGYDVDWRRIRWGEDVSTYDRVVVSIHPPKGLASRDYVLGALWCLRQRTDAVSFIDDHAATKLTGELRASARRSEDNLRNWFGKSSPDADFGEVRRLFVELSTTWRWPMIVPVFEGGDLTRLGLGSINLTPLDPSPFAPKYESVVAGVRERQWILASMVSAQIGRRSWPIKMYGNLNRSNRGLGSVDRRGAIPENELMAVYGSAWGVISPPHDHAGSGWWRVRYPMAADAGCVLSASLDEAKVLGGPYLDAVDRSRVEAMSDGDLKHLAVDQRACLEERSWSKERFLTVLRSMLKIDDRLTAPTATVVGPITGTFASVADYLAAEANRG